MNNRTEDYGLRTEETPHHLRLATDEKKRTECPSALGARRKAMNNRTED